MKKPEIKKNLQKWYSQACWYGYVITEIGKLRKHDLIMLAKQHKIELEYPYCN